MCRLPTPDVLSLPVPLLYLAVTVPLLALAPVPSTVALQPVIRLLSSTNSVAPAPKA